MSEGMNGDLEKRAPQDRVFYEPVWTPAPQKDRVWLHVGLFLLTAYTTTFFGMLTSRSLETVGPAAADWTLLFNLNLLVLGLPYSATLLAILGIHEMGHYLTSRRWRVQATLPYFIPFPSLTGTMGAVIRLKSRIPNRRALIDIGASGPLVGFVVAVAALGVGLHLSEVVAVTEVRGSSLMLGDSILSAWMADLIIGELPDGYDVFLHPVGFAGWLGLFVTFLNLLPIGQFDGGHIVYAIFGRRHQLISRGAILMLILYWALGPSYDWLNAREVGSAWMDSRWHGWLVWAFVATLVGRRRHPPPNDPTLELDPARKALGYLSLVIFVLCFIPIPISFSP